MSLRINHNLAALNGNRNLKLTTSMMTKSMQKLSSGFRINQAADDPAGLVISEQFRSQIAGLNRAIQNSEGSISMIQTAEGALTEINSLLVSMRELAIHAANEGFNDIDQLAADQAEIANAIKTIDRIAANTQFGTKKILDGSKDNIATITSANSSGLTVKQSNLLSGTHSITATKTADSTATLNTTSLGLSLSNTDGDPYNLSEKIHAIDVLQASDVAKKISGQVQFVDAFGNSMKMFTTATKATRTAALATTVAAAASGAGTYNVVVNYSENGESPTGNQTLAVDVVAADTMATVATKLQTQINLNSSLAGKLETAVVANAVVVRAVNTGSQYSLKTEASTKVSGGAWNYIDFASASDRGASANVLNFDRKTAKATSTNTNVTIASGTYGTGSTLTTAINTALATAFGTVNLASGNDIDATLIGTNQLQFSTKDEGADYYLKLNAGVAGSGNALNVLKLTTDTLATTGTNALVSFDGFANEITAVKYGSTGTATLYNKATGSSGRGYASFVVSNAQNGLNVGNLLLDVKATKFDVRLDGGPAVSIAAGNNATIFNADRSQSVIASFSLTSQGGTETLNNTDQSLVFQIGSNVGQTASIGIRNMSASSLGKNLPANSFTSLAKIDVTSVAGAQDAQLIIDAAINEVSTTRGTLGSFQKNTLESNLRNLRIASQNLTASESQIRDTDMAEEMSEFTKNQILVQAGTAMLAQANQMPQVVLSLFQ